MIRFTFTAFFLLITAITGIPSEIWANEPVKVGIFQNKPVVYFEDKPKGLFVELLDYIAEREGWEIEYVNCELTECFDLLKSHELDLMPSLGRSPGRLEFLNFSEEPIWTFWGTIYAHDQKIISILDLKDKNIGVRKKNKITLALQDILKQFDISAQYVKFDNYESILSAFHEKTLDAIAINNIYHFDRQGSIDRFKTPIVFSPFSAYYTAPKNGRHRKKLDVIDAYVRELRRDRDSLFHAFQERWFGGHQADWTGKKIGIVSAVSLLITIFVMAFWRYRSLVGLNRELTTSIEKRKQTEETLRYSENRFRRLVENAADAIFMFNRQGKFELVNRQACTALGYTEEELLQLSVTDIDQEFTNEKVLEITAEESASKWPITVSGKHHRKDGTLFPVEVRVDIVEMESGQRFVALACDVTEQKLAEEDRMRLAAVIDQASEVVVITDTKGSIQYVNSAFTRLTGYSRGEAIGQNPRILKSGNHDHSFYKKMWSTLSRGEVWKGHLINKKKNGVLFEEEVNISPVRNSAGQIINFVAVKRDVSREVSLENQLRQAMKMEAIGTLAGGIAHDFNNILAAILGYGEMARTQLLADDPVRTDIDQVIKAGNRAKGLVKQILTFSRQGEEDFSTIQIQPVIEETLKLLRSSMPSTILIQKNIDSNCRPVLANPTQIHQVIMNLCTNAKHAMADNNGTLAISLSEISTESENFTESLQLEPGNYLDLAIGDTGSGMDKLTQLKIFDPFFTTKEIGKGTGLGLAVVHGIIKQHKGAITVESQPGQGTVFHIYLPLIDKKVLPESVIQTRELPHGNERILIVDDEPTIVDLMLRMLDSLGYTTTAFTSSVKALEAYTDNPGSFDLLITDMTMPDLTGAVLAKKILTIRPDLPIILCTGFSELMDEEQAKSLGIMEFILKPILKNQLAITVRKVLNHG